MLLVVAAALAAAAKRSHRTVLGFPWGRIETANLLARPPEGTPRFLVMAHLDSKSQPLSSAWRATAIACAMLGWVALTTLAVVALLVPDRPMADAGLAAAALTLVGGALLLACVAGNRSPGALDNASGLATLLGVARRSRGRHDVAYLITDGEELGLAGAASSADRLDGIIGAINLDGLDDHGRFYIVERHGWPRRGHAPHLAGAILGSAAELGLDAERRPLPLGLLVDHIPFVEAGVPAVTLMRGSRQSLRVVHRPSDTVERLQGTGVFLGTALVAGALRLLQPPIAEERNGR